MKLMRYAAGALAATAALLAVGLALADFPVRGEDSFTSIGSFRLLIAPQYRSLFVGCPGYDGISRLQSPDLSDAATLVGRSDPIDENGFSDSVGAPVGTTTVTYISDSDMTVKPASFEPTGTVTSREVHTELRAMNLTGFGAYVKAGPTAGLPVNAGEVESKSLTPVPALDFPAESFFDVFVEVNYPMSLCPALGADLILKNTSALLVYNSNLVEFPPKVIYIHGNTNAVPVYFRDNNSPKWTAGSLLGWLVLAGHGAGYAISNPTDVANFDQYMTQVPEMPMAMATGVGGVAEQPDATTLSSAAASSNDHRTAYALGGIALATVAVAGAAGWYARRKRAA